MSSNEIIVVAAGLLFGYWIVSNYFGSDNTKNTSSSNGSKKNDSKSYSEKQEEKTSSNSWFEVLGVQEAASLDEIANAYKKKIRQYHPDKVESLGPELKKLAELKSKEINAAYSMAKKLKK
jgi:DnaJ like chaperone protein